MKFGIRFKQRDILIVPFPFTDLSSIKQRPVLVLSNNDYNKISEDLIVCGITSNLKEIKSSVLIDKNSLEFGILPKESLVKFDKLFSLEKKLIRKRIGRLKENVFQGVKCEFVKLF